MKCLIVQPIHEAGLDLLRKNGITPVCLASADSPSVAQHIRDCAAVITRNAGLDAQGFACARDLRIVVVHGSGHDPVDKAAAAVRRVPIATTPGTNARSVAELTIGLTLALARRLVRADNAVRTDDGHFRDSHSFAELHGKTALVVGWGTIGRMVGDLFANAFSMRVLVFSPRADRVSLPFEKVTVLADGLALADVVTLHTPLRPETLGLLDAVAFGSVKRGALLVNVARAGLVDEMALSDALSTGQIAGAALDVFSPGAPDGVLGRLPNVIFTPHLGGSTDAALQRTAIASAEAVILALKGGHPAHIINPEVL